MSEHDFQVTTHNREFTALFPFVYRTVQLYVYPPRRLAPEIPHGGPLGSRTRPAAAHAAPEVPG